MTRQRWAGAVFVFLTAEAALRLHWIAGGRWGYTACDRTDPPPDPGAGCGADRVAEVSFVSGWGALLALTALAGLVVAALRTAGATPASRRRGRVVGTALWAAAAVTGVAAFPLHLLFEIPAALAGRPSDWRDLLGRLALVAGAVLLAGLASAVAPPRPPRTTGYRPVPRWARRWAYGAVVLPVVGWTVPHGLWVLGVPFGIPARELADIQANLTPLAAVTITLVPPVAGLLVLGLVRPWGQVLFGHRVPPLLALVPAGIVALALVAYGILSLAIALPEATAEGWAVFATLLVLLGWGVAVGVTAAGYHRATRG